MVLKILTEFNTFIIFTELIASLNEFKTVIYNRKKFVSIGVSYSKSRCKLFITQ